MLRSFEEIKEDIENKYKELELEEGLRFLDCPRERLRDNNGILILGINPKSDPKCSFSHEDEDYKRFERKINIYLDLGQDYKIKKNIELLFNKISERQRDGDENECRDLVKRSLASNYVFFRTEGEKYITEDMRTFCHEIWKEIIKENNFKLAICFGKEPYFKIKEILKKLDYKLIEAKKFKWGGGKAGYVRYCKFDKVFLIGFYHFSYSPSIDNPNYASKINYVCEIMSKYV